MKPVLLVGGYGVLGETLARMLRDREPELELVLGGRSPDAGEALARDLGRATAVKIDLEDASLGLGDAAFSAVLVLVKDDTYNTMRFAARQGIPHVSLSSGAYELGPDLAHGLLAGRSAPIVLASHWYSGAVTFAGMHLAEQFAALDEIDIMVVVDRSGVSSGPASAIDFQRAEDACQSRLDRRDLRYRWNSADARAGSFATAAGDVIDGMRALSCDSFCLGAATNAASVRVLEHFGESMSRKHGGPPADEVHFRLSGRAADGSPLELRKTMRGGAQAPLTAITVLVVLERLLGISGSPPKPGLYLAEHVVSPAEFVAAAKSLGVTFSKH